MIEECLEECESWECGGNPQHSIILKILNIKCGFPPLPALNILPYAPGLCISLYPKNFSQLYQLLIFDSLVIKLREIPEYKSWRYFKERNSLIYLTSSQSIWLFPFWTEEYGVLGGETCSGSTLETVGLPSFSILFLSSNDSLIKLMLRV